MPLFSEVRCLDCLPVLCLLLLLLLLLVLLQLVCHLLLLLLQGLLLAMEWRVLLTCVLLALLLLLLLLWPCWVLLLLLLLQKSRAGSHCWHGTSHAAAAAAAGSGVAAAVTGHGLVLQWGGLGGVHGAQLLVECSSPAAFTEECNRSTGGNSWLIFKFLLSIIEHFQCVLHVEHMTSLSHAAFNDVHDVHHIIRSQAAQKQHL